MTSAIKRAFDDEDTIETTPDTSPDGMDNADSELVEAVEWLRRAGVVSAERPERRRDHTSIAPSTRPLLGPGAGLAGDSPGRHAVRL